MRKMHQPIYPEGVASQSPGLPQPLRRGEGRLITRFLYIFIPAFLFSLFQPYSVWPYSERICGTLIRIITPGCRIMIEGINSLTPVSRARNIPEPKKAGQEQSAFRKLRSCPLRAIFPFSDRLGVAALPPGRRRILVVSLH